VSALIGLGPLDGWLHDDEVSEVLVNAGTQIWVERRAAPGAPAGPRHVGELPEGLIEVVIERILAPLGRRVDRSSPIVDARLPDGSRVCAVLPPIAVDGPCLSVRRFRTAPLALSEFAAPAVERLLREVVAARCNVLVSGATSSGKTTLLNALAGACDGHERIVTLEDTAELRLASEHVLRLEARPATPDGPPEVGLAELLRAALRLRPDRLVVGEIRGGEALHLVQALNTGHDGSLATIHANGAIDALARLESLVLRESPAWPAAAVREQVRRSIDVVVHVARDEALRRHVAQVVEVARPPGGEAGDAVRLLADAGRVVGELRRRRGDGASC